LHCPLFIRLLVIYTTGFPWFLGTFGVLPGLLAVMAVPGPLVLPGWSSRGFPGVLVRHDVLMYHSEEAYKYLTPQKRGSGPAMNT